MKVVDVLELIAQPRKRQILQLVWRRELSAGEIAAKFDVSFSAVSQHVGVLKEAGLLAERRDGKRRLYRAERERLGPFAAALEAMWAERLGVLKALAEDEASSGGAEKRSAGDDGIR